VIKGVEFPYRTTLRIFVANIRDAALNVWRNPLLPDRDGKTQWDLYGHFVKFVLVNEARFLP
jgi:hypothetical protein